MKLKFFNFRKFGITANNSKAITDIITHASKFTDKSMCKVSHNI